MKLTPFEGELDQPSTGLKPFTGNLDGEKPSGIIRRVADQGIKLAQGIVGVPETAVGLADLVTGGAAGKAVEDAGVRFKDAKNIMGEYLSPEQKAADEEVNQTKGFFPTIGSMLKNPSTIVGAAVESTPSMLSSGVAARGLLGALPYVAPKVAAKIAAAEAAPFVASQGAKALATSASIVAGAAGEGIVTAGQNTEQVRQETPGGLLPDGAELPLVASGALTTLIGLGSGKLANKLGVGDVQTMLAAGKLGPVGEQAIQAGAKKGIIRKIGEGVLTEGILQELPQSAQEQVAQNIAQGKPWDEGVAEAGAQGLMAGSLMGGGANLASHFGEKPALPGPEAPAVQPPSAPGPIATMGMNQSAIDRQAILDQEEAGQQMPEMPANPNTAYRANPQATPEQALAASQALTAEQANSEIEQGSALVARHTLPSEAMGLNPAAGPMQAAAAMAVDTGAYQPDMGQPLTEAESFNSIPIDEASDEDRRAYEAAFDRPAPPEYMAMSADERKTILYGNKEVSDGGQEFAGTQNGDILNGMSAPFKTRFAAARRAHMMGKNWTIAQVEDGFVARWKGPTDVSNSSDVRTVASGADGSRGNQPMPGMATGVGANDAAGPSVDAGSTGSVAAGATGQNVPTRGNSGVLDAVGDSKPGMTIEVGGVRYPVNSLKEASELRFAARKEAEKRGYNGRIEDAPVFDSVGKVVGYVGAGDAVRAAKDAGPLEPKLYDPITDAMQAQKDADRTVDASTSTPAQLQLPRPATPDTIPERTPAPDKISSGNVATRSEQAGNAPLTNEQVAAKQIPDMTDAELVQMQSHYGLDHKRTAKITKEINRRALAAKLRPATPAVDDAAHQAATSPKNDLPQPSDGQKKAGNYAKGHVMLGGLDLSIENPAGSVRSGKDRDGKAWSNTLQSHYGYIKGTMGNDKDHVDLFIKPGTPLDYSGDVYVIDQVHPDTGKFDEHKVMTGFASEAEAIDAYHKNYAKGWKGMKAITPMPFSEFKAWVKDGPKNTPLSTTATKQGAPDGTQADQTVKTTPQRQEAPAAAVEPVGTFASRFAAAKELNKRGMSATHEVAEVDGGFVVRKKAEAKANTEETPSPEVRTATEHAGLKIYPAKVKRGDTVVDMWGVQTPDNARREKNGERQIGGDPLSETLDDAKKNAESEVRAAKGRAEREAESKAEDDAAQAKKDANKGKSLAQHRADAVLDKKHNYPVSAGLGLGTRRQAMQSAVDQGRAIVERMATDTAAKKRDQDTIDLVRARGYILGLSNENIPVVKQGLEAQARLKANQYEKPEYRVYDSAKTDGGFYEITKTEFDYAQFLLAKKPKPPHQMTEAEFGESERQKALTDLRAELVKAKAGDIQPFARGAKTKIGLIKQIASEIAGIESADPTRFAGDHLSVINKALRDGLDVPQENLTRYAITQDSTTGDMDLYIKVAADSIKDLRKPDVYRVLVESNKEENRPAIAAYIKKNRPDLAQEVDDVMAEATHKDPGEAPEAATAPVIAESLATAAKKEDRPLAEMKAELLGMIDAAVKETPNYKDYLDAVQKFGKEAADGMYANPARPMGSDTPDGKGRITFDVPGDGKFTVVNSYTGLMAFRAKIDKASGNGFSATKRPGLPASTSVKKGSTNQISAIESMLEDGDLQAAKDYMAAVGIGTDGFKKSALARMEQLEKLGDKAQETLYTRIDPEWLYSVDRGSRKATLTRTIGKDVYRVYVLGGTKNDAPADFQRATYGISKNNEKEKLQSAETFHDALVEVQTALDKLARQNTTAEEKQAPSKASDTGWNMAGTGYAGKRYTGRNMTLDDGREVVARIYENAGFYEEAEVKVDGKRVFAVTDRNDAQGKVDNFIKTLTSVPAELNLMGFTKTPTGNGTFTLSDSNMRVTVEPTGTGFQARMGSGTSGPRLTEQQAIEWAATMRDESIRIQKQEAKKDAPAQARRTNPAQTIEFKNPIVGPSGEKLVSYTWQWKPFEYVDKTGEERIGKLSDWDKSTGNVDTGREVVHQFTVENKDGESRIVSAESAIAALGYADKVAESPVKSAISAAKTLARNKMRLAELESALSAFTTDQAEVNKLSPPEVARGIGGWWSMGDSTVRQTSKLFPNSKPGELLPERMKVLEDGWRSNRLVERGWNLATENTLKEGIYDTKAQIKRAQAKLDAMATPTQELSTAKQNATSNTGDDGGMAYPLAPAGTRYEETSAPITMMTPDAYLSAVRPLDIDESSRDNIEDLKAHILSGKKLDPLHIRADGKEDGRHRAVAAKELGIAKVPVVDERPAANNAEASRIENFGDELPPARRAIARQLSEDLTDDAIAKMPLSQIWPASENDAIEDPFVAAAAHVMREAIPSKPRKAYKVKSWVSNVQLLRGTTALLVSGRVTRKQFIEKMSEGRFTALRNLLSKIKLLEKIDRSQWVRVGDVQEWPDAVTYDALGNQVKTPQAVVMIDDKRHNLKNSGDLNDHMDAITALLSGDAKEKRMAFEIRGRGNSFFINKTGDKQYRHLMEFTSAKDASDALENRYEDVVSAWEAVKKQDNITERDLRAEDNRPRSGKDWRNGKDVSAEDFQKRFGFKGGEFGKWVSQGKGAQERQFFLNSSYDALMDLADIVGIPPNAISLEGTLGIAFGSRGNGWASAHFEPSNLVINLTKPRGAGSLAHEWFHALDNYFARKRGGEVPMNGSQVEYRDNNYLTHRTTPMMVRKDGRGTPITRERLAEWRKSSQGSSYLAEDQWIEDPRHKKGVRAEVEERFEGLVKTLNDSPMAKRARVLDGVKENGSGYWSRTLELAARAFENYVQSRMLEQGYHNDFLANVIDAVETGKNLERYPYLMQSEIAPVADAFASLFDTIQTKETESGTVLFSRSRAKSGNGKADQSWYERLVALLPDSYRNDPHRREPLSAEDRNVQRSSAVQAKVDALNKELRGASDKKGYGPIVVDSLGNLQIDARDASVSTITGRLKELADELDYGIAVTGVQIANIQRLKDAGFVSEISMAAIAAKVTGVYQNAPEGPPRAVGTIMSYKPRGFPSALFSRSTPFYSELSRQIEAANFSPAAKTQSVQAVEDLASSISAAWENGPRIVVAFDMQDARIPERVRQEDQRQRSGGATGDPEGFYYDGTAYLLASQLTTPNDIARVLFHEALGHYGLRKVFGGALKPILQQIAIMRKAQVDAKIKEYGLRGVKNLDRLTAAEEVLAEMAQTTPEIGFVKRAIAAIRNWLRKNVPGFKDLELTDNDIIQAYILPARRYVEGGGDGGPGSGKPSFSRAAKSDQTQTKAFNDWFGDSKVVDADGKPLVVYHGTASDISTFRLTRNGEFGPAIYTTADHGEAGAYAQDAGSASLGQAPVNIMPVYVSLQNPFMGGVELFWRTFQKEGDVGQRTAVQRAIDAGFDGVIATRKDWRDKTLTHYIAFKPEQIKSATGNNGNFDPANPDIRFSRAATVNDLKQKATNAVNDFVNTPGKLNWWHKTVGTQYNLAQRSPEFKRVFEAVQSFINDVSYYATEAADKAPTLLPKLETWRDIAKSPVDAKDAKAIAAPIFEGTLIWGRDESGKPVKMTTLEAAADAMSVDQKSQRLLRSGNVSEGVMKMWRGLPIDQYESIINGKYATSMLKEGVVWTDAELKSMFNLTKEQISMYREFRSATDKSLKNLAISDMLYVAGKDAEPIRDAVMEEKSVESASEMLRDYLMSLADLNPDRKDELMATANKIIEKSDQVIDLMDRGYAPLSRFGQYTLDIVDKGGERVYFGLFENRFDAAKMARDMQSEYPDAKVVQGTLSQESYKLFSGVSPETVALFGNMMGLEENEAFQQYVKLSKSNRSAMKRLIQRKGIAGFNEDAGRVLAGFVYSNARQTSQNIHAGEMNEAAQAIPNRQGELKDAAVQLVDYIKNPQEEAQAIRGLLFAQYIGGSVASAAVNMTQPLTMTLPWLSQFGGIVKAGAQLTRAMKDLGKRSTGDKALDDSLKRAEEDGTVSPQEVHELMRQSQGKGALQSGDGTVKGQAVAVARNSLSRIGFAWGKLFSAAEQFNRRVTYIAAYRTAVDQKIADPDAFARKAIHETQGIYNKGNKPKWARGPVGATLFTFKQYSVAYVEMMHRMASQGGPEGKRAALYGLGILLLLSGVGGAPGADDLDDLLSGALQSMGYNFDSKAARRRFLAEYLGNGGAEFVDRGISGISGVPIDVSGRLGLGNLIPGTGLLTKKQDHTRDVAELAGPAGDLFKRGFEAAGKVLTGDIVGQGGAVSSIAPRAAANLFQAADMATTGMYRDGRGKKVIETDGIDAFFKALGFQPNDVKQVQDNTFEIQRMVGLNKLRESEIADKWAAGLFERDESKVQKARDDLSRWNEDNPESPIRINPFQIAQRVRAMNMSKSERIAKTAPKELRQQVRQALDTQ